MELPKLFSNLRKLRPLYLVYISAASSLFLLIPQIWFEHIHVGDVAQNNRHWIKLVFLISVALFLKWGATEYLHRKKILKCFHTLTEGEKEILRFYFAKKSPGNVLRVEDSVVQRLRDAKVIHFHRLTPAGAGWPEFVLDDFARKELEKNMGLLKGESDNFRSDAAESVKAVFRLIE